jgi:hypothetical protein
MLVAASRPHRSVSFKIIKKIYYEVKEELILASLKVRITFQSNAFGQKVVSTFPTSRWMNLY